MWFYHFPTPCHIASVLQNFILWSLVMVLQYQDTHFMYVIISTELWHWLCLDISLQSLKEHKRIWMPSSIQKVNEYSTTRFSWVIDVGAACCSAAILWGQTNYFFAEKGRTAHYSFLRCWDDHMLPHAPTGLSVRLSPLVSWKRSWLWRCNFLTWCRHCNTSSVDFVTSCKLLLARGWSWTLSEVKAN